MIDLLRSVLSKTLNKYYDSISVSRSKRLDHDIAIFKRSNSILVERELLELLDWLQTDDSYHSSDFRQIDRFCRFFVEEGNQYLKRKLRKRCLDLIDSLTGLGHFVAFNFFVYPNSQEGTDFRLCLHPELNIDRAGSGKLGEITRYGNFQRRLDSKIKMVRIAYKQYRMNIKKSLLI